MKVICFVNESEISRFTTLIRKRLTEIQVENQLGQDSQAVVQLDQSSVGRLSRMDALQNQAMAKAQQTRRNALAFRLRAALKRIDEGEYGYCEDCGDDIALKRLELDPAATRCINCASAPSNG